MASKPIFILVAVAGIAAASGAAWWFQHRPAKATPEAVSPGNASPGAGRSPAVEAARVELAPLTDDAQTVGSLRSRQSVMLRPEVSGRVTQLNFRDGERVRRGQLLVQLDDQLPLAQVQQAQAELSIARANNKRNQDLVAQNFISQRSVEESAANLQVAEAKLALAQATAARLRIVAPFDGIAGIRNVNLGDYLKDGADIVNIEDLDAIFVDFRLPERFQTKLQRGQRAVVDIDSLPGIKFTALVQAIDPLVDANGRSVGVRGCIDNRQLQLRPGMFARITTVFGERQSAKVVPEEAIVPQGGRQFVIRLAPGAEKGSYVASRIPVKVGIRRPGRVEIVEGLKEGDMVVTAGQQRVQGEGMTVRVVDAGKPAGVAPQDGAPRPAASPQGPAAAAAAAASAPVRTVARAGGNDPCAVATSTTPGAMRTARPAAS